MRLREWIVALRSLHEKARQDSLTRAETTAYREAREELAAMLLAAQRLSLKPGETAREALRVVRTLPLELSSTADPVSAVTLDISVGGFSALLESAPRAGERLEFSLQLGGGPILGHARVASVFDQGEGFRVSFSVEGSSPADAERMTSEVLDAALEKLGDLTEQI